MRRQFREIYYFSEKEECDFVIIDKGIAAEAIQVCYELNPDNLDRGLKGLTEALAQLQLTKGKIITVSQKDQFHKDGFTVDVVPCHEFLAS